MNILICDDKLEEANVLGNILQNSDFQVNTNIFCDTLDALNYIQNGSAVDLCFLDILMPEMSGIELAGELRQSGYTGEIVFLSISKAYGPESYTVGAFSYLLKPPTADHVGNILNRLKQTRNSADMTGITVKTAGCKRKTSYKKVFHLIPTHVTNILFFYLTTVFKPFEKLKFQIMR